MATPDTAIETLEAILDEGAERVRVADRDVTYRPVAEIERQIARRRAAADKAAGVARVRTVRLTTRSGW